MGHGRANGTERTADGRFARGNPGSPGRPPGHASVATTGKYLHARPGDSGSKYPAG